jgi:hypothetical protein
MAQKNTQIPFLPGYQLPDLDKENHKTSQTFMVSQATMVEKKTFADVPAFDQSKVATLMGCTNSAGFKTQHLGANLTHTTGLLEVQQSNDCLKTGFQTKNRAVLGFLAFFTEPVFNSRVETQLTRKVKICFYLEDDTIQINEEKVRNSGIPQGDFLKRQKVYKDRLNPQDFLDWRDLTVGKSVRIFEREFTITGTDEFTSNFLAEQGHNNNADGMVAPIDEFTLSVYKKHMKVLNPETKFFKEYMEAKNGGGNPNKGLEQYIANDRKVLSFQAVWNDTAFAGDLNYYTLNYFLADDKVEVKEPQVQNSGKHPFPLLLRKARLPKKNTMVHCPGMAIKKIDYYTPHDFIVGQKVTIFGRECLLYDCDKFTRDYFRDQLGIEQGRINCGQNTEAVRSQPEDPPYNGFGSEQDSLGNCRLLIPKPPKVDMLKLFKYDSIILRFICERITGTDNDRLTHLILNFFVGDDTISIYQTIKRNAGITGGKFLERKKYKNKARRDEYFATADFQIGAILEINNYLMRIVSADDFTIAYMQSNPDIFPLFELSEVRRRLREGRLKNGKAMLDVLLTAFKADATPYDFVGISEAIKSLGVTMSPQEVFSAFITADAEGTGHITGAQFAKIIE